MKPRRGPYLSFFSCSFLSAQSSTVSMALVYINCPLCGMLNLASKPAFSLLQEACHTNPSLPLPVKKAKVVTTPRSSSMGTSSRSSAEKEKSSVTCPPTSTSPHSHSFSALIHNTHDVHTSHPKFVGILRFLPCDTSLQHPRPTTHLSSTHLCHIHTLPQESVNNLGLDTAPSTLTAVKKVCFLSPRARVEPRHPSTLVQRGPTPVLLFSHLYPLLLLFPTIIRLYHNILNRASHHSTNPQRPPSAIPQNTQPTHSSSSPLYTHQKKMDISPEGSPSAHEEVLHTFTILEIDNAPTNTLSFGLIQFLDAALAQTGENIAAPTFLEYDYSPKKLANRDNILRLLVRDKTPQEDINYYDMGLQLLSSDLLHDHECGLLSAHPCDDKVCLD